LWWSKTFLHELVEFLSSLPPWKVFTKSPVILLTNTHKLTYSGEVSQLRRFLHCHAAKCLGIDVHYTR
jgi:hypothetical protein